MQNRGLNSSPLPTVVATDRPPEVLALSADMRCCSARSLASRSWIELCSWPLKSFCASCRRVVVENPACREAVQGRPFNRRSSALDGAGTRDIVVKVMGTRKGTKEATGGETAMSVNDLKSPTRSR